MLTGRFSAYPAAGLWQVAQLVVPEPESRLSKNSFSPRSTSSFVSGLLSGRSGSIKPSCRGIANGAATATPTAVANSAVAKTRFIEFSPQSSTFSVLSLLDSLYEREGQQ